MKAKMFEADQNLAPWQCPETGKMLFLYLKLYNDKEKARTAQTILVESTKKLNFQWF